MNDTDILRKAKNGDKSAMEKIVTENSGLVWSIVKRHMNRGYESQDLYQIGCIGLIKAVRKFDFEFNVCFSTYAVPLIMGEIKRFLRDDGMIKVSRHYKELAVKAAHVREKFTACHMREPTVNELAEVLQVQPDELAVALEACNSWESIYKTIGEGDKDNIYLIDKLASENSENDMLDLLSLKCAFGELKERERKIIAMRFFMDKTQCQVAERLGISQVQVSRIEKKVLGGLKERLTDCV